MARKFAAVALSLGCLHTSSVFALGLGDLKLESFLNEPLKAEVKLLNTGSLHEDQIKIRLATREDFERMGVERAYFLTGIKFEVEMDSAGQPRIIMTTDEAVLEPYLDFIVEARWPSGRLLREYTVLVDPPAFDDTHPVISAREQLGIEDEAPAPAPAEKKQELVATSGTRVDVRKSDLAPGQMPQRDFNADTAAAPAPGARYMIKRDETLWEIARDGRPEGASVHQTMLDIQRLNPHAFIDGNINRIKAGYIVYLPSSAEITSHDEAEALANVRQQNEDWRAGRSSTAYTGGPALRISAEEPTADSVAEEGTAGSVVSASESVSATGSAAMEEQDKAALESGDMADRLVAMEQQVETLERIVSLKDEQIAALQEALAETGAAPVESELETAAADETGLAADLETVEADAETATLEPMEPVVGEEAGTEDAQADAAADEVAEEDATDTAAAEPAATPAPAVKTAAASPKQSGDGGLLSYILYGLGALFVALLAFLFLRGRGDKEDAAASDTVSEDVFADVELNADELEVLAAEEDVEPEEPATGDRGYGEEKHDKYASDVEASDALAEADIYIAYGRYPQAAELLKNAAAAEPNNPIFVLKLLQIAAETGDSDGALQYLADLEKIGDADSMARAEEIIAAMNRAAEQPPAPIAEPTFDETEVASTMEQDFGELEIEEPAQEESVEDDLDLSADFEPEAPAAAEREEEDLVIAADSNGMSTKLDLARAYLDMGDEDGARQILEEVVAEGSDEVAAEARSLLDRIG